ncbi:putativeATP-dependent Clp protease ATP-binding subunit [Patulibacter medicamentivorans]|uniref:PutativeATP-dependent Clp protease ATP-binding subunit n=1 Tax=Patulibacter medicamentivorans TaxID=1097667 RepID=H0E954_9ACTN|nr:Clp protease N-terminal domain-containing protein [Patulibacter medicamentivorans]EHN09792.1 putativeATP-dependent Clp protease ATP-binding subunit [Patulibacter medicamentivorans]
MKLTRRFRSVNTIKLLLTDAEAKGRAAGESHAGAEHLLLAALDLPDGLGRRALVAAGADPDAVGPAIEAEHDDALRAIGVEPVAIEPTAPPPPSGPLLTGASAQAAFRRAAELSRADRRLGLTGAHVVLAVAEMEHGTAARALRRLGVDGAALRAAARAELDRAGGAPRT